MSSNFEFLAKYWPDMARIGTTAEAYLYSDPNACIYKLGMMGERIVSEILSFEKIMVSAEATQAEKIKSLRRADVLPKNIDDILFSIRKARNDAVHEGVGSHEKSVTLLQMTYNLCCWFMEVYGDWNYQPEEYVIPEDCSSSPDFAEILHQQEERILKLSEEIAEIKTGASSASKEDRAKQAEIVSESMELSESEANYLLGEQVRVEINLLPVVNYALQQNGVSTIQSITIVNNSLEELRDLELCLSSEPDICLPLKQPVEYVPAQTALELKDVDLTLNGQFLAGITERVLGMLAVTLSSNGTILYSEKTDLTVLAYDEWHGYGYYPELLTAFVTPNNPSISLITAQAASLLEKWTGDPSLDGYQSMDINRVLKQAAAVYGALQEQNIIYSVPPASFETIGQRVRLSDTVIQQKKGTCLDLSLLYASCLEAMGLNPILVLKKGHIFAGVWLEDLTFSETVQDDVSVLTKRLADGVSEIAVVECTAFTAGKNMDFDTACTAAKSQLYTLEEIEYIIDVHRARISGMKPLPTRVLTDEGWIIDRPELHGKDLTEAPQNVGTVNVDDVAMTPETRKQYWERKLLDLGLRNTLINLRLSKSMVPILATSVDDLENALSDGEDFSIFARPSEWHISGQIELDSMHDLGAAAPLIQSEFKNHRLRSTLTEAELEKNLKGLYRTSKTALEENGANTLYLALGLLKWYENPRSTKARYAPLILLPIEMVRKSAAKGYVIRLREDEPQMNITLLEKLKLDFQISINGLDPLPLDEHGIDTRKAYTIIRKAIMGQKNWDVLESAFLGIFSFSQFVMWNDIRNRSDDLSKNKIVRSLLDGKLSWDAKEMYLADTVPEDNVFLPLPADASQLYAIEAASQGESFVLHGPPGTGKSQTITALIANALAQGKTVLFVAEKMAALEVVQKRLERIGLGPFCLELHSNKSRKKDVLEQLRQASEVVKKQSKESYTEEAERIAALRADLNQYAKSLHRPQNCGLPTFELINNYELHQDATDIEDFSREFVSSLDRNDLYQRLNLVQRLVAAGKETGHPHGHPLSVIGCEEYSQSLRMAGPQLAEDYRQALLSLQKSMEDFRCVTNLPIKTYADIENAAALTGEMSLWLDMPKAWAASENFNFDSQRIQIMAQHYQIAAEIKNDLLAVWNEEFLKLNGDALSQEYQAVSVKWFLPKMMGINTIYKKLTPYAKTVIAKADIPHYLDALVKYQSEEAAADTLINTYGAGLGKLFAGENTDWADISQKAKLAGESALRMEDLTGSPSFRQSYCAVKELQGMIAGLREAWVKFSGPQKAFDQAFSLRSIAEESDWISSQIDACEGLRLHIDELKEWITWNAIASEAIAAGLENVVTAYRDGLPHGQVEKAYLKAIYKALTMKAIDEDTTLNHFSGAVFNEKIAQFRKMDENLTALTKKEIFCRLASRIPNFTQEAAQSSELGILQRAIRSNGRGLSIRKLFEQIPNMLPRLCPCMLMSPISAAQYLDPNREPFDIVVFDEASQLPTCKAVGALARGNSAVIVGDPKQMPPTSFFAANVEDEDHPETEDLESILDDCLALNMPQTHLLWHYRSRHESLIAYSNSQFYENKLYTFPSVNDRETRVRLVHVDGTFDRGKSRQNREEAEAIIEELKRRCHDPKEAKYSVGVVTFNVSQQNLIDDLLCEACEKDAALEEWVYQSEEPLFIKNLENVQGDERDVILFSIGYGPDKTGKVSVNFGPLNREGGWRRLNVAISRARCEMVVFATLLPDQINLSRTSAAGVAALKGFLTYATGEKLSQNENSIQDDFPCSGIADSICAALQERGYTTDRMIGNSEYKVDIGVVDPKNPEQYILGILLDGSNYGSSKTTRDREIAQLDVLKDLGWRTLRIWSMDWWDNSRKELNRIFKALEDGQECQAESPEIQSEVMPVSTDQLAAAGIIPQRDIAIDSVQIPIKIDSYVATQLSQDWLTPDQFIDPANTKRIVKKVWQVLETEAPISESLLIRRVVQSFDIARSGSRIQNCMTDILRLLKLKTSAQDGQVFYWEESQDPKLYAGLRTNGEEENSRDIRDVPVQEVANAVYKVLYDQISMPQDALVRESAKLLGYSRTGGNVATAVKAGIMYARQHGGVDMSSNGMWALTKSGTEKAERVCARLSETK